MSRSTRYDPDLADQAVRDLAAVTDQQLAADIRAAAVAVLAEVNKLAAGPTWPSAAHEKATYATLRHAAEQLTALPVDAGPVDVRAAVGPILGVFWPNSPAVMQPAHDAIEELRHTAMHHWSLVRDAREIAR